MRTSAGFHANQPDVYVGSEAQHALIGHLRRFLLVRFRRSSDITSAVECPISLASCATFSQDRKRLIATSRSSSGCRLTRPTLICGASLSTESVTVANSSQLGVHCPRLRSLNTRMGHL